MFKAIESWIERRKEAKLKKQKKARDKYMRDLAESVQQANMLSDAFHKMPK